MNRAGTDPTVPVTLERQDTSLWKVMMPKAVAANEAKNRLGALLRYVSEQGDEVIVESHGKPRAVIMSIAAYEETKALREQKRRTEALQRLRDLQGRVGARNQDLTEDDAIEIADRVSHELIDRLAESGTITFERDRS